MSGTKHHLNLMRLHCGKIADKMDGKTLADRAEDENLRDAVCMRLLSLAESVKEYLSRLRQFPRPTRTSRGATSSASGTRSPTTTKA
jgi:hypothetical protein